MPATGHRDLTALAADNSRRGGGHKRELVHALEVPCDFDPPNESKLSHSRRPGTVERTMRLRMLAATEQRTSGGFRLGHLCARSSANPIEQQKRAHKKRKYSIESITHRMGAAVNCPKNRQTE